MLSSAHHKTEKKVFQSKLKKKLFQKVEVNKKKVLYQDHQVTTKSERLTSCVPSKLQYLIHESDNLPTLKRR